uniref:Uncharacterized protein n=1 Tax=Arundo donax TaxID=35708 RepID=A0A0A8Y4G7_ARUDO
MAAFLAFKTIGSSARAGLRILQSPSPTFFGGNGINACCCHFRAALFDAHPFCKNRIHPFALYLIRSASLVCLQIQLIRILLDWTQAPLDPVWPDAYVATSSSPRCYSANGRRRCCRERWLPGARASKLQQHAAT